MAMFRYEAVDKGGQVVRGVMDAANEQAVQQRLTTMGYSMKAVLPASAYKKAAGAGQPIAQTRQPGAQQQGFPVTVAPVVPLLALVRFYRQLATLVKSGMPLIQSMDELYNTTYNKKLKKACMDMKDRVARGDRLSSAMAAFPHLFPVNITGLVWCGELGGYLDRALVEAADAIEKEYKDNRQASYGWWFFNFTIAVPFILCLPVLNMNFIFEAMAKNPKAQGSGDLLPSDSTSMDFLRGFASEYLHRFLHICLPILLGWLIGHYVWKRLKRVPSVRRAIDGILLAVPAWGKLHKSRARERFVRSLNQLYQAGIAPGQAWAAASMSVRNSEVAARLRSCEQMLRNQGGNLQQAFAQAGVFSVEDAAMVATGERAGAVPEMLTQLTNYQAQQEQDAKRSARGASIHSIILVGLITAGIVTIMAVKYEFQFPFQFVDKLFK